MKKQNKLVAAADDLQTILGLKPPIKKDVPEEELKNQIKKAALWLIESDEPMEETIEVLKEMGWTKEDFENLEDPKEQNPIPVFKRFGIIPDNFGKEKPKTTRKPRTKKVKEPEPEPEVQTEDAVQDPEPEPEHEKEESKEHLEKAPPKRKRPEGPSAYGTAIAMMGPDPNLPLHELYEQMKEAGFDLQSATGSIKTAHSICKKVYLQLKEHGHIKEGH